MIPEISKHCYQDNALLHHVLNKGGQSKTFGWFSGMFRVAVGFIHNSHDHPRAALAAKPRALGRLR